MDYPPLSGFGGGMYQPIDMMGGINDALAQNAQQKPKNGFGNFLRNTAGYFGDYLTGRDTYSQMQAQMQEQQRLAEWYEKKRQDEMADYEARKNIDAKYSAPDYEGSIDEFQQAKQLGYIPEEIGYQDFLKLKNPGTFIPPAPTVLPYNAEPVGGGNLPRVSNQAEYNALPPGSQYMDPNGNVRTKGGQSAAPAGGFP